MVLRSGWPQNSSRSRISRKYQMWVYLINVRFVISSNVRKNEQYEALQCRIKQWVCFQVYAVSMVIWECVTARVLYDELDCSLAELQRRVREESLRPPLPEHVDGEQVPQIVLDILLQGWVVEPSDRPTAAEISAKLHQSMCCS